MQPLKSDTELFEFLALFPVKYKPLEDSLSCKKTAIEIDLDIIKNYNIERCIEKFGKVDRVLIPNENFNLHPYEIQVTKNYEVDFFAYIPTYIEEMEKCFLHVVLLDRLSQSSDSPKGGLPNSMSLRYMYEMKPDPSLKYVTSYAASCLVLMEEFLAETRNHSYEFSKKSLDAFFK